MSVETAVVARPRRTLARIVVRILVVFLGFNCFLAVRHIAEKKRRYQAHRFSRASPPRDGDSKKRDTGLARAKRVEGLSYLEGGKYDKAVAAFSDALRLDSMGELGDLADLMKIAKSLQDAGWPPDEETTTESDAR